MNRSGGGLKKEAGEMGRGEVKGSLETKTKTKDSERKKERVCSANANGWIHDTTLETHTCIT